MTRSLLYTFFCILCSVESIFIGDRFVFEIWFTLYLKRTTTALLPYDGWSEHTSPLLPRPTMKNAIGYDPSNHAIWIVGGYPDLNQLVSFDYVNNTFTDYGQYGISRDVFVLSQHYAQIEGVLYIADRYETYINAFNMKTMTFTSNYTTVPLDFNLHSCFVNIRDKYLAILGSDTIVQILEIESEVWFNFVPKMHIAREYSSCIYINDKTFIIGGTNTAIIEFLNVSSTSMMNITSESWMNNTQSLPYGIGRSRCITVNDDILVIGGYNGSESLNTIYIINSISGSVSLGGYLSKAIYTSAVIFANNIIYSFGGYNSSGSEWNGWETLAITQNASTTTYPIYEPSTSPIYTETQKIFNFSSTFTTNLTPDPQQSMTFTQTSVQKTNSTAVSEQSTTFESQKIETSNTASTTNERHSSIYIYRNVTVSDVTESSGLILINNEAISEYNASISSSVTESTDIEEESNKDKKSLWFKLILIIFGVLFIVAFIGGTICVYIKKQKVKSNQKMMREMNKNDGENEIEPVRVWLTSTVGLAQYVDVFINNGYDSLEFVAEIKDKNDLIEIGIMIPGHRTHIMSQIECLREQRQCDDVKKDEIKDIEALGSDIVKAESSHKDSDSNDDLWEMEGVVQEEHATVTKTIQLETVTPIETRSGGYFDA